MGKTTASPRKGKTRVPAVHVTLAMFDSREPVYRVRREGVPIERFTPLGPGDYMPSAMTPLRDAVAQFIGHLDRLRAGDRVTIGLLLDESGSMADNREAVIAGVNEFVGGMSDVEAVDPAAAGKVLAVIVTDGLENSSREVDPQTLARSIAQHEQDGWTFIYMGANQDTWAVGEQTGLSGRASGQSVHFRATPAGTRAAMGSVAGDARQYLRGVESYAQARTASARRSVTEDGEELLTNLGAQEPGSGRSAAGTAGTAGTAGAAGQARYAGVDEALARAKEATRR
jgi:hypothetical protein